MGLMHAVGTARAIRDYIESPVDLALAHDAMTESRLAPWYTSTVKGDRVRTAQITEAIRGRPLSPAQGRWTSGWPHGPRLAGAKSSSNRGAAFQLVLLRAFTNSEVTSLRNACSDVLRSMAP